MVKNIIILVLCAIGYALMILLCEYLNKKRYVDAKYTRKLAHVITAFTVLLFPYIFDEPIWVYILTGGAAVFFFVARQRKILNSIDGISQPNGGSYFIAIAVGLTFFLYDRFDNITLYVVGMIILGVCDPLANIVGQRIKSPTLINGKTLAGSGAFLVSAMIISVVLLVTSGNYEKPIVIAAIVAITSTIAEMISGRGTDNLTIPLSVAAVLILAQ